MFSRECRSAVAAVVRGMVSIQRLIGLEDLLDRVGVNQFFLQILMDDEIEWCRLHGN